MNDVIYAYRKYFRKVVETWNMQNKIIYSLAQTAHKYCFIAAEKLNCENFNEVIRGLNNRLRKFFQYARMTSLKFSKFNFSAAISNIYAQFVPVNRGFYSVYFMFQLWAAVLT